MNVLCSLVLALSLFLTSCALIGDKEKDAPYPVLGLEPLQDVTLFDSPDEVLVHWARNRSRRGLTLIHMSMQGGLAPLAEERADRLRSLIRKGHWEELESARNRGDNSLVTPWNYLTAAAALGIIGRIYWVVPDSLMEYTDAERRTRQFLERTGAGFTREDMDSMRFEGGCVSGRLRNTAVSICGMETLPAVEEPVLLDMDITFIMQYANMKHASPLRGFKMIYDGLANRMFRVGSVTITASDMLSRSVFRYLGTQTAEALQDPQIMKSNLPPEVWLSRDTAAWAFSQGEDIAAALKTALAASPGDRPLALFGAVDAALRGKDAQALETLVKACAAADRSGCSALLYVSSELKKKQRYADAERFLKKALALRTDWPDALREYGDLLYAKKDYRTALQRYQELAAIADSASVQFAIGDCFYFLGQERDGLDHYTRGLAFFDASAGHRLSDRDREALTRMAELLEEQHGAERAKTVRRLLAPSRTD